MKTEGWSDTEAQEQINNAINKWHEMHRSNEEKSILAIFNKVWRYSPILKYL
jgi:hypothetical protein